MSSPSFPYSCPPPPYSHPSTASAPQPAQLQPGLISPPESRRTSGDEAPPAPPTRHSLPSIQEALGRSDPGLPYPQPAPPTSHPTMYQPPVASSQSDLHRRPFAAAPPTQQEPHHSYSQPPPQSPYTSRPPQPMPTPQTPTSTVTDILSRPTLYAPQHSKLPTLQPIRTGTSPVSSIRPSLAYSSQQQSPAYDSGPQSAPPAGPYTFSQHPQSSFSFGAPQSASSGSFYPAATVLSAPPRYPPPPAWRAENDMRAENDVRSEERQHGGRVGGMAYGESVKRHLENFDLEASLNEIAESSGRLLEFTHEYGSHAHASHRAGHSAQSIPQLHTVDELMLKSRKIQESLLRIRDVVIAQAAAMEEQLKDSNRNISNGYAPDPNGYADNTKGDGGFAGSDTKKRRGRAAPPGRCHSCNRAETPEWRRGPDGARTLCNACGLHYAKLTRKMGSNKAPIGNSNLRPKSMGSGSPPA